MKHKHAALIKQWADDTSLKFEGDYHGVWVPINGTPLWYEDSEYRLADPYRDLKEAYARGEVIQIFTQKDEWVDVTFDLLWNSPVVHYRIKPTTKKVVVKAYEAGDGHIYWNTKIDLSERYGWKRITALDKEVEL